MATSLARQLKARRSDVVATLDRRKHQKADSLLFERSEAAEQDYESVLALGLNGLQSLILIDPRFKQFEQTLFSRLSYQIDRSIQVAFSFYKMFEADFQTKLENDNWDLIINTFLDMIAPHLLSTEAMKALEWLIRRFKYFISSFLANIEFINSLLLQKHFYSPHCLTIRNPCSLGFSKSFLFLLNSNF